MHQHLPPDTWTPFEQRKQAHLQLALDPAHQATGHSGLHVIALRHAALPEVDFHDVHTTTTALGQSLATPFCVSAMTAGHPEAMALNHRLARACQDLGWLMGVGSQRRELHDPQAHKAWQALRQHAPQVRLLGNIGLTQAITTPVAAIQRLIDPLDAIGLCVHTNPLQECLQPEGTPNFKGGLNAIEALCKALSVPVVVKETGCGFAPHTLQQLAQTGVYAVDVSGLGGTHWGRIEGARAVPTTVQHHTAQAFAHWGVSTVQSILHARAIAPPYHIWASGGVRSGLDAAKLLAMGAQIVGLAKPILAAAQAGEQALYLAMQTLQHGLKVALFCTGHTTLAAFQQGQVWTYAPTPCACGIARAGQQAATQPCPGEDAHIA